MLEGDTLKELVHKLTDFINPRSTIEILIDAIDKYAGNESKSSWDIFEYVIEQQLKYMNEIKERINNEN